METLFTLKCTQCLHTFDQVIIFCPACKTPNQEALLLNDFQILGIQPHTILDKKNLKSFYVQAQKNAHPNTCLKDPALFALFTQLSSRINSAFQNLSCPFKRSLSFLQANGINDPLPKNHPPATFESLLDLRAKVSDLETPEATFSLLGEVNKSIYDLLKQVVTSVNKGDSTDALLHTAHINYLLRIKKDIKKQTRVAQNK